MISDIPAGDGNVAKLFYGVWALWVGGALLKGNFKETQIEAKLFFPFGDGGKLRNLGRVGSWDLRFNAALQ